MEEFPLDNSNTKNINFGVEGIFLGLLFFILVLLGLNYFKILSLSYLHPFLSFLPQKQQVVENNTVNVTDSTSNTNAKSKGVLIAEEKAKKAGYSVSWAGDTEDGSGRAILASEFRTYFGWVDKFGWQNADIGEAKGKYRAIGLFDRWEKIVGANDYYVILRNPLNNEEIKGRILIDKSRMSNPPGLEDDKYGNRTRLFLEDMSFSFIDKRNSDLSLKKLGYFFELKQEDINKHLRKGDVVVLEAIAKNSETLQRNSSIAVEDVKDVLAIGAFFIRRFN